MGRKIQRRQSEDPIAKARRERNRQAQIECRQRRQRTEKAQQDRIYQLEEAVDQLSGIIVTICDDLLGVDQVDQVVAQASLVARLEQSIRQAVSLSKSVMDADEPPATVQDPSEKDKVLSPTVEVTSISDVKPTVSPITPNDYETPLDADPSWLPTLHSHKWSQYNVSDSGIPFDLIAPFIQNLSPPTDWSSSASEDEEPFAVRLVEVTMARACLLLTGQIQASPRKMEYIFGATLRRCTREDLLRRIQRVLGPARAEILRPAGINWKVSPFGNAQQHAATSYRHQTGGRPDSRGMLTAMEVAALLEEIGACFDSTQMDSSRLATILASTAICMDFGPAYPRHTIDKAIQASLLRV
ncbi:uncharacterized protein F5Z01DRAFT_155314 [Emericellopsis atlantica]|uniref:BZIP domain-containing protein n=1 Tax=Emericellopsis atlantica TaxID=2614577 RepID=A0A9P8CN69_9HYPO|nr:uncharacterized protein F5Z01DRAFT_155314 [Emericellopsis atlantica]KAG9253183.1 hypothetical protein F5Z01DRAFT_155314 [Emericellopsis atlantica]